MRALDVKNAFAFVFIAVVTTFVCHGYVGSCGVYYEFAVVSSHVSFLSEVSRCGVDREGVVFIVKIQDCARSSTCVGGSILTTQFAVGYLYL